MMYRGNENRYGESKVYSAEQSRVWAHMIQMKQHTLCDDPLINPFPTIRSI